MQVVNAIILVNVTLKEITVDSTLTKSDSLFGWLWLRFAWWPILVLIFEDVE